MTATDPTYLGHVSAVSGSTITVKLAESLSSGLAMIDGHTYRVGQVGSFVRIPLGYQDLYGVVAEIGAAAAPQSVAVADVDGQDTGRWMRVELAGEATGDHFERGLSQHPNVDDAVHLVTQKDLRRIYGGAEEDQIEIGTLSSAENIVVRLSLDALVTRHSAIVGSTGSGKSTTVASLLRSIVRTAENVAASGARILLLDVHGEYSAALGDLAKTFSASPSPGEEPLFVPYWALEADELLDFVAGGLSDNHLIAFTDKIQELKEIRLGAGALPGSDPQSLTVDSPVPFSLKKLWYDLIDFETATFTGPQRDQPALEVAGDPATLTPPHYKPHAMGAAGPFLNQAARRVSADNLICCALVFSIGATTLSSTPALGSRTWEGRRHRTSIRCWLAGSATTARSRYSISQACLAASWSGLLAPYCALFTKPYTGVGKRQRGEFCDLYWS